jgi:thioesterase domain-containing protein
VKVATLLAKLRDRDIRISVDGDRLRCSALPGRLTPELREELRRHKKEIVEFLRSAGSLAQQQRAIVPLQPHGARPPVFAFGGHNGDVFCFRALAQHLGPDQPFFGLQPPGLDGHAEPLRRVEALAEYFAAEIRAFRPKGPYGIAGYCAGGTIAFELARQLLRQGMALSVVALFGAPYPTCYRRLPRLRKRLAEELERLLRRARAVVSRRRGERRWGVAEKRGGAAAQPEERPAAPDPVLAQRARVERATFAALRRYAPGYFANCLTLFVPCSDWVRTRDEPLRWRSLAQSTEEFFGPHGCTGDLMLREPYAATFANLFRQCEGTASSSWSRVDEQPLQFPGMPPLGLSGYI